MLNRNWDQGLETFAHYSWETEEEGCSPFEWLIKGFEGLGEVTLLAVDCGLLLVGEDHPALAEMKGRKGRVFRGAQTLFSRAEGIEEDKMHLITLSAFKSAKPFPRRISPEREKRRQTLWETNR